MAEEESEHRRWLIELHRQKFGERIPLVRRQDVSGFVRHPALWLSPPLVLDTVRKQAEAVEYETRTFYEKAAERTTDASIRKLLGDLAAAERGHESLAEKLGDELTKSGAAATEDDMRQRMFVLQVVQPGLAGLMDGSVSTLAPLFAAAFATHNSWETFLVGMAASVGAGVSMGFAEALSDDGSLTGRGKPWIRGVITGAMTTVGGIGHTLPYLIPDFWTATIVAILIVLDRTVGHRLDPRQVHGHPVPARRLRSGARRPHRVRRGDIDRQCVRGRYGTLSPPNNPPPAATRRGRDSAGRRGR